MSYVKTKCCPDHIHTKLACIAPDAKSLQDFVAQQYCEVHLTSFDDAIINGISSNLEEPYFSLVVSQLAIDSGIPIKECAKYFYHRVTIARDAAKAALIQPAKVNSILDRVIREVEHRANARI